VAFTIRAQATADAPAYDDIIRSLPYHFGNEAGRQECARAVRADHGLVAVHDGAVVGFLTVERHFEHAAEITWMAVHATRRGQGIGRALIERLCAELRAEGRTLLLVMTLGASYDEGDVVDSYERTRSFYRAQGFIPAREWADFWPDNPALLMVKVLEE
jgi:GNAT superfamily N-acetyltransferase